MGGGVLGLADDVEDACPDKLLELYVFVSCCEDGFEGLLGAFSDEVHVGAKLIVGSVEEENVKEGVRVRVFFFLVKKEFMTFRARGDIVNQDADFISESFVVKLVTFFENSFKDLSK